MKLIIPTTIFVLTYQAFAWEINKNLEPCLKDGGPGISVPGILTLTPGKNGALTVFNKSKSKCPAIYCKCKIQASGSIFPPKLSTFSCIDEHGCTYSGANMFGLTMRRMPGPGCKPETIKEADC